MKKKFGLLVALLMTASVCFSQAKYAMFETMYITPKQGKYDDLKKGLIEHNKKWHADGTYKVWLWDVLIGKHEGQVLWGMGPCTFTDLDSRPDDDAHNQDWQKNVDPFIEKYCESGYWKINEGLSYVPQGEAPIKMADMMLFKIRKGQRYRFDALMKQVSEVYKQMNTPYTMYFYESQMARGDAPEIAVKWYFDKWAYFDKWEEFKKDFEGVHGEGSMTAFWKEYNDVVEFDLDEILELME